MKPEHKIIKINMDGSVLGNDHGCGGTFRDYKGNVVLDFTSPLIRCSNFIVKLKSMNIMLSTCT